MKQKVFLAVVALFMLFAGSLQTKADSNKDYYSKVVVNATPLGAGKVYAAYNGGDYKEGGAESGKVTQKDAPTHAYKIKAVANDGYTFSQWDDGDTNAERTDISVTAAESVEDATVTYTATFTADNYTITLVPGAGSVAWTEKAYTIESDDVDLPTPTPNDPSYQFDGWYDNDAFTGDRVTKVAKGSFGNKTFYANYVQQLTPDIDGEDKTLHVDDNVASGFSFVNVSNTPADASDGSNFYYTIEQNVTSTQTCPGHETEVVAYDAENNKLIAYNAGTATITFTQNATALYVAAEESYTITVEKLANAITINGEANYTLSVPFGKQLTVASANPANTIVVEQTSGAEFATYDDAKGIITTGMAVGLATWNISQDEDYKYLPADAMLTVNVEPAAETESYVLIHDDEESLNMYGGTKSYAVSNYPKRLSIQVKRQGAGTQGFTVKYNGVTVLDIANGDLTTDWKTFTADLDGSVIANVEISSGGTLNKYYRNLRVTRKTYLNVDGPIYLSDKVSATMTVDWSCANGGDLKIVCDNDKFTFSQTTIAGVDNNDGKTDITVTYNGEGSDQGTITIFNDVYRKDVRVICTAGETINISDAGFATYAVPFNATITRNGAEVWYVSGWTSESLTFSKYEGETLLKGEGILLKQGSTSVTFTPTAEECLALEGNKLKGNIVPTAFAEGEIFILSNGDNGVGFYPNTAGTLKAGKAYLVRREWETAAGGAIGEFQMLFDDETDIQAVPEAEEKQQLTSIYNLAGQRIAGLQKGINIVNGKKILK